MASWHERLQDALTVRGKSWGDLVDATRLSEQSVYAWRPDATRRTVMMNAASAARVCSSLAISPLWLFEGVEPSGLDIGKAIDGSTIKATASEIALITSMRALPASDALAITHIVERLGAAPHSRVEQTPQ